MNGRTLAPSLLLDPDAVPIDLQLAQRVPYALSRYYMALPLAQDNGCVSVAMAYPDNAKARLVLGRLLKAQVVPVFTPAEALLPVLDRVYRPALPAQHVILAWHDEPQWATAVTATTAVLGDILHAPVLAHSASELGLEGLLALAAGGAYALLVLPLPDGMTLPVVLRRAATPLYFIQGEPQPIRRILVVLRGYASDERALDWLAPFAGRQQATVTLMPLANGAVLDLGQYHRPNAPAGQHLARCLQRLQAADIQVTLKFRHGRAVQQVVAEVSDAAYDLLVLAAEAEGDFVRQVITAVAQNGAHSGRPIFVLKPPEPAGQTTP